MFGKVKCRFGFNNGVKMKGEDEYIYDIGEDSGIQNEAWGWKCFISLVDFQS